MAAKHIMEGKPPEAYQEALWKALGPELTNSFRMQKMSRRAWLLNWFVGNASKKPANQEMMTEMIARKEARKTSLPMVHVQDLDVLRGDHGRLVSGIDAVFLDLDGTIYLGGDLIEGAEAFLSDVTAGRSAVLSFQQLIKIRLAIPHQTSRPAEATEDDVLLSTHDLLAWLQKNNVTETWFLPKACVACSRPLGQHAESQSTIRGPRLRHGTDLRQDRRASIHMHAGVPLVASHPDMVCPSPTVDC